MGKKGIEVYLGVRILKDGSFKVRIDESELRGEDSLVIRGRGWFNLEISDGRIRFVKYDTRDSPFHNFTSSPAHTLLKVPLVRENDWVKKGESNYFILRSYSEIKALDKKIAVPAGKFRCLEVETEFEVPGEYTGPPYLRKRCWFAEGVGIVRLEVDYQHKHKGKRDIAVLKEYQLSRKGYWPFGVGNKWVYQWDCQFGPNKFNIHNTGQEGKYKPPRP